MLFHPLFLRTQCVNRLGNRHFRKSHFVARPQLPNAMHVSRDDIGDFRIAAGRLLINEQDNRLSVLRHLDRPRWNAVGQQLP